MPLQSLAKWLILGGAALLLAGCVFLLVSRFFPSGMPGDVSYKRGQTAIYRKGA